MNFFDTYDITGGAGGTNTPPAQSDHPEPSLNEEVTQVIGQLGRFWGGFRKQSQTALEAARKDLGDVVQQAQKELSKLTAEAPAAPSTDSEKDAPPSEETTPTPGSSSQTDDAAPTPTSSDAPTTGIQTLFSRLQASLPPNIVSSVQANLPDTLKNTDLAQLRATLGAEFQRVQGVTRAQAEEYLHQSEGLLREVVKEAQEALKDAVKVVPPEELDGAGGSGVVWDGSDMWMLPNPVVVSAKGKGKEREGQSTESGRPSGDSAQRAVATRAESLLKQLKHDPAILKADPEAHDTVRALYRSWVEAEITPKDGGLEGAEWTANITAVLADDVDGEALKTTHDVLVPSEMTESVFWSRYFFRVHQIEVEEAKRKALIQQTIDNDEDFTWEDDEEETATSSKPLPSTQAPSVAPSASQATLRKVADVSPDVDRLSAPVTPATTSPRESSEESYDLVSSGNVSTSGDKPHATKETNEADEDSAESDWE
ncbi:hypothetical protein PLICRDRAFT_135006 [Plicaturopsis crispa FD-325 SS-3]|nr:hypothetical protein PLICRDRAFT_135006 [Plicaturopsis crispa FD-325 SS-3]